MVDTSTHTELVTFTLNGVDVQVRADHPHLLAALREELDITSPKDGCSPSGQCGCCTVHLAGQAVKSCTLLALQADGATITTIEGIGTPERLHPVQQAYSACHGLQCGFCTPGMVMATIALLERYPDPSAEQIREGLAGNLCRCTGYINIEAAVRAAAAVTRT